jgi:general secretion pathway protein H
MSSADRTAGFTLIEVVAVMLIVALVASLVITMPHGTGRASLKAVTLETATLLRRERVGAILGGRARRVSLAGDRRVLVGDSGDTVAIPPDVAVDLFANFVLGLLVRKLEHGAGRRAIRFKANDRAPS